MGLINNREEQFELTVAEVPLIITLCECWFKVPAFLPIAIEYAP
jgi:hypothetical protein